jgi:hypothetical protein
MRPLRHPEQEAHEQHRRQRERDVEQLVDEVEDLALAE